MLLCESTKASCIKKNVQPSPEALIQGIHQGNTVALARAITLVESTNPDHFEQAQLVIEACLKKQPESTRIGITGVPGVGKSTFIEVFGNMLIEAGHRVAVLAVDPTSTISKGSIMGDKTRMPTLATNSNAFIRPSPSGTSLGGVARKTRESIILCEAAGFDIILVETVGVGQSETAVHSMVDFFLLLKLAGAGDELQGIKRGIIEMADAIVINKAEGANVKRAKHAQAEFKRALHLFPPKSGGWVPDVLTCSAVERTGISEIWEMIRGFIAHSKKTDTLKNKRSEQNRYWLMQHLDDLLKDHFHQSSTMKIELQKLVVEVEKNTISPFKAAEILIARYRKELK